MRIAFKMQLCVCLFAAAMAARADETLAELRVGKETFRNITVTGVTKTDLYFSHAGGIGTAKLKNLDPQLQQRFNYDPAAASAAVPVPPAIAAPAARRIRCGFDWNEVLMSGVIGGAVGGGIGLFRYLTRKWKAG